MMGHGGRNGAGKLVHDEIAGWSASRAPDMHDVMRRADHAWRAAVVRTSSAGVLALAVVLVAALIIVVIGPHFAFGTSIRDVLLAH